MVVAFKLVVLIPTVTLLLATIRFVLAERTRVEARSDRLRSGDVPVTSADQQDAAGYAAKGLAAYLGWAGLGVLLVVLCSPAPSGPRDLLVGAVGRVSDRDPAGPVTAVAVALTLGYGLGLARTTWWVWLHVDSSARRRPVPRPVLTRRGRADAPDPAGPWPVPTRRDRPAGGRPPPAGR